MTYANLEDSGQRGANLAVAVMLNANLDFTDLYSARLSNTIVKGGGNIFLMQAENYDSLVKSLTVQM